MALPVVILFFGIYLLCQCETLRQQLWTIGTVLSGAALVAFAATFGDVMVEIFSLIGYLMVVVVSIRVCDIVSRRQAPRAKTALTSAAAAATLPTPASNHFLIAVELAIFVVLGGLALSGSIDACYGLMGMVIGFLLSRLAHLFSKPV